MVLKIITNVALVVAQNKKNHVQVLVRGAHSKSEQHSPPASLLDSSTKVPATRLERQLRIAQSNHTQGYVAHIWKNHHRLLLGNWDVFRALHISFTISLTCRTNAQFG